MSHRAGFVSLIGKPNVGKSTLLNALVGEKLSIISPKVQTTRHRIAGILTGQDYQIVFSDTPGIIDPQYKLQKKMMGAVNSALEDADIVLFLMDIRDQPEEVQALSDSLKIKVPKILVLNKSDLRSKEEVQQILASFSDDWTVKIGISALHRSHLKELHKKIISLLPESPRYFPEDALTDRPERFFISEIIREKLYLLFRQEIPYHAAVLVREFKEKSTLTKISADIIVQRETQKGIIIGKRGQAIKELGTLARKDIEAFLDRKVFLELKVKVRDNWREKDVFLREYGYNN